MDLPEEIITDANVAIQPADAESAQENPTRDVATFWNRLDEVFDDIKTELGARGQVAAAKPYKSYLFQPDRISLNSHDAQQPTATTTIVQGAQPIFKSGFVPQESFSQFTIVLEKPLVKVKSLQLLSAIIPMPQPSIPDNQCWWFYYYLRNLYSSVNNNGSGGALWQGNYTYKNADVVIWDAPSALIKTVTVFQTVWQPPNELSIYTFTDPTSIPNGSKIYVSNPPSYLYTVFTVVNTYGGGLGVQRILVNTIINSFLSTNTIITAYAATSIRNYWVSNANTNLNNPPTTSSKWVNVGQSGDSTVIVWNPWNINTTYAAGVYVFYLATDGNTYYYQSQAGGNVGNNPQTVPEYWTQISRSVATSPNWFDISTKDVLYTRILSSTIPPEIYGPGESSAINTTYADYPTFVQTMNAADNYDSSIPGYMNWTFNPTLNRIVWSPNYQLQWVNGVFNDGYYYLYTGWNDPNYKQYCDLSGNGTYYNKYGYTLNLRAGFTWNGQFSIPTDPWNGFTGNSAFASSIFNYFTPKAGANQGTLFSRIKERVVTANTYPCLVYTQSLRIYCDVTQGSTQDSAGNAGLLSVVPMAATSLGVTFYQNNFNRPLTKVIEFIPSITISMKTDSGDDYILPSNASVSLELAIEYE